MNTPPSRPHALAPSRLTPYALRLLFVALAARFAWELLHALDVFADYHAYYRAAANLRAGADIYAEGKLLVERNSFDFWTQTDGQYVYPPALAIALLPLTILDIGKGGPTWLLILTLATLVFPWLLARTLGHHVGLYVYLVIAFPTWAILPLALGIRYNIVEPLPILLAILILVLYLTLAITLLRHRLSNTPPLLLETSSSPPQGGGVSHYPAILLTVFLPILALTILLLDVRTGQIDPFLLKLAAPGLIGTTLLPWLALIPITRAITLRADLDTILPFTIPVLGATPLLLGLRFGQADILLLLLTTLAFLAFQSAPDAIPSRLSPIAYRLSPSTLRLILAGIALGAAAAVKPTLALFGLYYLKKRAWPTLVAALVTGLTLGLAPFLLLGPRAFADWFAISRYFSGDAYPTYPSNQSLRGLLLRAFSPSPRHTPLLTNALLADLLWYLAIAIALFLWWRYVPVQRQPAPRALTEYALTTALILFAAPLSEDIHYVALLFPLALLAYSLIRTAQTPRWSALAIAATLAFILPLPALTERITNPPTFSLLASAPYLYGLFLVTLALTTARRATS